MLTLLFLLTFAHAGPLEPCGPKSPKGEPCLAAPEELSPTQFSAGFIEVRGKEIDYADRITRGSLAEFIETHPVPAVIGPEGRIYIVDGHHFGLACLRLGVKTVIVDVVKNWSDLSVKEFWKRMEDRHWVYLRRLGIPMRSQYLPKSLDGLMDDPYRSLADSVRKAKGFKKARERFSEFEWAEYFRGRIPLDLIVNNYGRAILTGVQLARSKDAKGLPGWNPAPECELELAVPL